MIIPDYFIKKNFKPKISENPSESLSVCVVIPSFNESSLDKSLLSLANCKNYNGTVEVIVVVNHPENSSLEIIEQSQKSVQLVNDFNGKHGNSKLNFYTIKAFDLPNKHAGVGLARQRGMDEAAFRLFSIDNPNGVIACFDADATCADNYLEELEQLWIRNPETTACSIRYEHPISGTEFPPDIYKGIA
ncbi:MAG TPA: glycosyltransferase, partial [Tenuifilaceae bacterium]|nr:glycosyltransferase [Tenuifilaceae bacterium]